MRGSSVSRRAVQRFRLIGSVKVKLLLCFCILFTLILLLCRGSTLIRRNNRHNVRKRFDSHRMGYTLLINTWKRNDLLLKSISHYVECPRLQSVRIVWSEPESPSKSLIKDLNNVVLQNSQGDLHIELKFDINKEDSLNNRFKEIKDLKTNVIFSIDDDVIFPCSSVELAFSIWQRAPDTMVGFVPRMHWLDESVKRNKDYYVYGGWWSVWWTGTYSMVLSKAAFFHKKYLQMYTLEMPSSIREYVAHNRNCEDMAMSFLVANATGAPPLWVRGKIFEIGSTGISSLGGHSQKRTQCVNRFAVEYGKMPLVSTSMKVLNSRSAWFW